MKNCNSHTIEMAINEIRKASAEFSLMDCEVRSIFNMGLAARYDHKALAILQKEDKKILVQKMAQANNV